MKKKKLLTALSLLLVSTSLASCDGTSTLTSSTSTSPSGSTSTSSGPSTGNFVTETLNNGFSVETGIPAKNGTITAAKVGEVLETFASLLSGQEVPAGSYAEQAEFFVPTLRNGGVNDADADLILSTVDEAETKAALQAFAGMMSGSSSITLEAFLQNHLPALTSALKTILSELDADKFAAVAVPLLSMTMGGATVADMDYRNIINGISHANQSLLRNAPEAVRSFFDGVLAHSNFGEIQSVNDSEEAQEMVWFFGRAAYGILKAVLENFTDQEIASIVTLAIQVANDPQYTPTAETILPLAKAAGKIIDKCFMDRASFHNLLTTSIALTEAQLEASIPTSLYYQNPSFASERQLSIPRALAENSDSVFNILKFVGVLLENATEEDFQSIMTFIGTLTNNNPEPGTGEATAPDMTSDVVRLAKIFATNLTRFGADNEAIMDSFLDVFRLLPTMVNGSMSASIAGSGTGYRIGYTIPEASIDMDSVSGLVDAFVGFAQLDPDNLTDEQKADINATLQAISAPLTTESTFYFIDVPTRYEVGSTPAPLQGLIRHSSNPDAAEELVIPASEIQNLSTESVRYDMASFTIGQETIYFPYYVTDYPVDWLQIRCGLMDSYEVDGLYQLDPSDAIQEVEYSVSGSSTTYTVPFEKLIDAPTEYVEGVNVFYVPLGEDLDNPDEYYAVTYQYY